MRSRPRRRTRRRSSSRSRPKRRRTETGGDPRVPPAARDRGAAGFVSARPRRGGLRLALLVLAGSGALACAGSSADRDAAAAAAESARWPNLVLFLVDDLGWQDLSVPLHIRETPFNERYRTPAVERLAERGLAFTNAYASAPVCTPTRTSLHTGQSPARTHITYWTLHAGRDTSASYPGLTPPDWNLDGLQPGDVVLAELLRSAGYRTIHVGKAHLGAVGTPGADPLALGFDVNVAGHGAGAPGSFLGTDDFKGRPGSPWDVPGLEEWHGDDVYLTEVLAEEAERAVRAAVEEQQRFFLHFAPYAVHTPITANERYLENYEGLDPREAAYATMVETYDAALGQMLDLFDELGIAERTVVVFTSDNGGLSAHGRGGEAHVHNAPLRSGKGSAYEGGVRVPWIVSWPGITDGVGALRRCDVPVITHDLFPTFLSWAGVRAPEEHEVDGVDLTPLLAKPMASSLAPRDLHWHQPHFWGVRGPGIHPFTSIRSGDWKLLYPHDGSPLELYDLASDLGERTDLAAQYPDVVRDLAERSSRWLEESGAQLSLDAETGEPVPLPRERAARTFGE